MTREPVKNMIERANNLKKKIRVMTIEKACTIKIDNYTHLVVDEATLIDYIKILPLLHSKVSKITLYGNDY